MIIQSCLTNSIRIEILKCMLLSSRSAIHLLERLSLPKPYIPCLPLNLLLQWVFGVQNFVTSRGGPSGKSIVINLVRSANLQQLTYVIPRYPVFSFAISSTPSSLMDSLVLINLRKACVYGASTWSIPIAFSRCLNALSLWPSEKYKTYNIIKL